MTTTRPTPADLAPFLDAGEIVRWSGAPPEGLLFRASDVVAIPFSLLWGGFAIFWNVALWFALIVGLSKGGSPSVWEAVWGLASLGVILFFGFVFLGLAYYIMIGRFFTDAKERARTLYAITDRRAVIAQVRGRTLRDVRGYELTLGGEVGVRESARGTGSITFGQPDSWFGSSHQQHLAEFTFERIRNVRDVARIVEEIRTKAR